MGDKGNYVNMESSERGCPLVASCICFLIMPAVLPGSWHLAVPPHVCHLSRVKVALCSLVSSVVALIMRCLTGSTGYVCPPHQT